MRERPITYKSIRERELRAANQRVQNEIAYESAGFRWPVADSGLLEYYVPFQSSFEKVLPTPDKNIKEYIEETLQDKKGTALGLELGGVGSNLFASFSPGFFAETASIALLDGRKDKKADAKRGHRVIEGDMTDPVTKDRVDKWLNGRKLDFIIERLYGAHECLPNEPFFMAGEANHWYKRLSGLWLAEAPDAFLDFMPHWTDFIEKHHSKTLEVQTYADNEFPYTVRMLKSENSPEDLPVLDKKAALVIYSNAINMKKLRKKSTTLASDDEAQT